MEIKEVSKKIKELIEREVSLIRNDNERWKNHYDSIMKSLEWELDTTNETIIDYTESKLTLACIEAEGYKRCLTTMINKFRYDEEFVDER